MGILSGNQKEEPMHYGEISAVWSFSAKAKGSVSCYQVFKNHAGDQDLKKILEDLINQARQEITECDALLADNGFTPPPAFPDKPQEKVEDIPAGARLTDQEIAALISADVALGLVACSQTIGMCIREDIAAQFAKYHNAKLTLSGRILRMNKEKGWLVPPPLQMKRPELVETK